MDDFESKFGQLEKMGSNTALPETFKTPLLLSSLGTWRELLQHYVFVTLKIYAGSRSRTTLSRNTKGMRALHVSRKRTIMMVFVVKTVNHR